MDDFSFPSLSPVTDSPSDLPYPHFAASPLWFLSSASAAVESDAEPSCSGEPSNEDGEKTASEKMDQLWEELNDDVTWVSLSKMEAQKQSASLFLLVHTKQGKNSSERKNGSQALGRSDSGGGSFRQQSAAVVAALKAMKKVMSTRKHEREEFRLRSG